MAIMPDKFDPKSKEFGRQVNELLPHAIPDWMKVKSGVNLNKLDDGDMDFVLQETTGHPRPYQRVENAVPFESHGKQNSYGGVKFEASFSQMKKYLKENLDQPQNKETIGSNDTEEKQETSKTSKGSDLSKKQKVAAGASVIALGGVTYYLVNL